ncbi:DUF4142 domain-containing protein [Sphingomonas sp. T9W2]|uniref:DUF4142 domain-containing protein n=1 Tax=Sphingomonas sp. T9W2 TaxID=3143183 RepID=UPI0031F49A3F
MARPMMIALTLSVLAAGPALAQTPATYVAKAGASDLYERTSSQLVLQSTRDPKIREFATMMIRDHQKSTADVKQAATAARVPVPAPKLEPMQAQMVAELRAKTGAERDRTYVTQQRTAHQQALALHSGYAQSGTTAPLKAVAVATAPVVQHHIEMLRAM